MNKLHADPNVNGLFDEPDFSGRTKDEKLQLYSDWKSKLKTNSVTKPPVPDDGTRRDYSHRSHLCSGSLLRCRLFVGAACASLAAYRGQGTRSRERGCTVLSPVFFKDEIAVPGTNSLPSQVMIDDFFRLCR